jgi:single-strand DNA-binding protein
MSFNKITMVGNLGRDPELRNFGGASVCNFNVAVSEPASPRKTDDDGPTWFRVTVWGKRAISCARHLRKGSPVYVAGRLKSKQWQDPQGDRHYILEVKASDIRFFGLDSSRSLKVM